MSIDPGLGAVPVLSYAQRLRIAREYAGLEQTELAERAQISRATISAAERGHRAPTRATLALWAWACGVSRHWLETGEAPSPGGGEGASELPQLDSNQQPFGYGEHLVTARLQPSSGATAA